MAIPTAVYVNLFWGNGGSPIILCKEKNVAKKFRYTMGSVAVLDLDETLVHACSRKDLGEYDDLLWAAACAYASQRCKEKNIFCFYTDVYFIYVRPGAIEMLRYCRASFDFLVIFTAGNEAHAKYIQRMLFEGAANVTVDFCFHRDSCGKFGSETLVPQATLTPYQKNLCHIREIVEQSATEEQKKKINWKDCLFVEDFSFNALTNCGETLIVPKFDYPSLLQLLKKESAVLADIEEASSDDTLIKLVHFIQHKKNLQPRAD